MIIISAKLNFGQKLDLIKIERLRTKNPHNTHMHILQIKRHKFVLGKWNDIFEVAFVVMLEHIYRFRGISELDFDEFGHWRIAICQDQRFILADIGHKLKAEIK